MVDDDGDVIMDKTSSGLTCDRRVGQEKFMADYAVTNCADSVAPGKRSKGDVTITATTDDGVLEVTRTLKCSN